MEIPRLRPGGLQSFRLPALGRPHQVRCSLAKNVGSAAGKPGGQLLMTARGWERGLCDTAQLGFLDGAGGNRNKRPNRHPGESRQLHPSTRQQGTLWCPASSLVTGNGKALPRDFPRAHTYPDVPPSVAVSPQHRNFPWICLTGAPVLTVAHSSVHLGSCHGFIWGSETPSFNPGHCSETR